MAAAAAAVASSRSLPLTFPLTAARDLARVACRGDGALAPVDTGEVGKVAYGEPGHTFDRADYSLHVKKGSFLQNAAAGLTVVPLARP